MLMGKGRREHRYVKGLMEEAGLDVREDGMGNIFGRLAGSSPSAGARDICVKDQWYCPAACS